SWMTSSTRSNDAYSCKRCSAQGVSGKPPRAYSGSPFARCATGWKSRAWSRLAMRLPAARMHRAAERARRAPAPTLWGWSRVYLKFAAMPEMPATRARRNASRAFTLVELMVVVAIVGVLATIGITLFRKHVDSSRSIEAINMIQSIRAAHERWRAETQRYLRVSTSLTSYYPRNSPTQERVPWSNSGH